MLAPGKTEFLEKTEAVEGLEGSEIALQSDALEIYGHSLYNTASFRFTNLTDDHGQRGRPLPQVAKR